MVQDNTPRIFELGQINFNGKQIYLEEITLNVTRDLSEYYTTDSFDAKAVRPGRKKIDFTIRKAKDMTKTGTYLLKWFASTTPFKMDVYALNVEDEMCIPRRVATLDGCRLSKNQIGNFDATKPVQEDIDGKAYRITWYDENGAPISSPVCGTASTAPAGAAKGA